MLVTLQTRNENEMNIDKGHSYIGREPCGCCTFIMADDFENEKIRAKEIAKVIRSGRIIERISWEQWVSVVSKEPTFMSCPHPAQPNKAMQPTPPAERLPGLE